MIRAEAAKLVAVIIAGCPQQGTKLTPQRAEAMVEAFESLLDDVPYALAQAAVRVILHTSPFIPSVAEIRAAILELGAGPAIPGGEAWGKVLKLIGRWGMNRTPGVDFRIEDPLLAAAIAHLGWRELCTSENQAADRKQFVDLYERLTKQARREAQSPMLGAAKEVRQIRAATTASDAITRALEAGEDDVETERPRTKGARG